MSSPFRRARGITQALRGRWHGTYGVAFCPAHENRRTPALSLSDGSGGRLLVKCHAGCPFADILTGIRRLRIETGGSQAPDLLARPQRNHVFKQLERARLCWSETLPTAGTLAEAYRRGRGIISPLPDTLRFHPSCWHLAGRHHPALVATVELRGRGMAVHRTYLAQAGGKARVEPKKAMLGPCRGAAVCLSEGAGPLASVSPRVWAALSTSGMAWLDLPESAGKLVVAPDPDAAGWKAAEALASRAYRSGWRVNIPPPADDKDWNDVAGAAA